MAGNNIGVRLSFVIYHMNFFKLVLKQSLTSLANNNQILGKPFSRNLNHVPVTRYKCRYMYIVSGWDRVFPVNWYTFFECTSCFFQVILHAIRPINCYFASIMIWFMTVHLVLNTLHILSTNYAQFRLTLLKI